MHLVTRRLCALALAVAPFVVACGGDDPNDPRDRSRPTLVTIDPANGSTNVERDLLVVATFSEALDPASVTTSTFTVKTAAGAIVPGIVEVDSADVGFLATARLAYATDYVVTITSGIRDRAGNAAVPTSTTFRTEPNFPPRVVVTTPPNGATNVAVNTSITVGFSENVLPSSVNATTFTVTPTGGTAIAGTIAVDNAIATFTPSAPLMTGTTYTVRLTNGITDLDGASIGATYTFTFTTPPNQAPSANAGPSQDVNRGELVQLNGSGTDPEGEALTYKWTQIIGPDVTGGVGYLTGQSPSFTAPSEVSSVRFELRTTDARGATSQGSIVDIGVFEDKAHRIFVSPLGNDANPGTRAGPVKTINRGVQLAAAEGTGADVYVTNGLYEETVNLATGVSIYGGYQSGTWLRSAPPTFIRGTSALNVGVFGQDVSNLTLDGLDISANEPTVLGGSAYGVFLINAQNITVTRDSIRAGPGQVGTGGQFGFPGAHGQGGGRGGDAVCSATPTPGAGGSPGLPMPPSAGSQPGVAGGAGGNGGAPNAPGSAGTSGQSAGTNSGGSGGPGGAVGGNGNAGGFGASGLDGAHGIGGAGFGTFSATGYTPADGSDATSGTTGSAGGGGGGGGGGAAANSAGGGGGGGGAGGGGGNYGQGGKGGGGSFAFVALNSTGIVLDRNVITSHNGGFGGGGGRGGNGGNGGPGNIGGQGCGADGGNGGTGGPGGAGGSGGHGGGGGGGPSIAIVEGATSQITIGPNNILEHGNPGPGGTSQAGQSIGATGIAVLHKKLP